MKKIEIYDGIRLHFLNNKKFNTACIAVIIRRNLTRQEVTKNALLARVLGNSCLKYRTVREINEKLDNMLGAAFNADVIKKGSEQLIEFFCEVYDNDYYVNEALSFLGEILFSPLVHGDSFCENIVENEKNKLRCSILSRKDNKKEYAKQRLIEEMLCNEPYGIYGGGFAEDIDSIDAAGLYGHYKKILRESPIEILIMSNVRRKTVSNKCLSLFQLPLRKPIEIKHPALSLGREDKKSIHDKEEGLSQGKLCIGLRSGVSPLSESFFPLLTGNEILGGGGNSKLFLNLREKENLCYYISSFIYRFSGIICIQSGVSEDCFEKALELISNELEELKSGSFTENDVEAAKKSLIKSLNSTMDYNNSLMDFYLTSFLVDENETMKKAIRSIENTDKNEILKAFENVRIDTVYTMGAN